MLDKIDALIVDHRHGKFHLNAAIPFIKRGIPTFIDKPFCYRLEAGKKFLALAKEVGTPVTSFSSIAHSYETFDIKRQVASMGEINQVVRYGPIKLDLSKKEEPVEQTKENETTNDSANETRVLEDVKPEDTGAAQKQEEVQPEAEAQETPVLEEVTEESTEEEVA